MGKHGSKTPLYTVLTVALSFLVSHVYFYEESPIIRTSSGKLQGNVAHSRTGRKYYQFLGIPFAQPPVGKLRFESPQPVLPWNGTLEATRDPPACKGFDFFIRGRTQGDESCLFLNVMTPVRALDEASRKNKLPVVVHIHGGGFHMGCAKEFPGTYFMDEDVVLVTLQYRLGIFGFLTTDDGVIRGNMGLKDQVMALKWVKENIEQFGGDSNQITIIGHSAGGASVHLLMLSKMASGLFNRAVTFATDGISEFWQFNRTNTEHLAYMSDYFNCSLASTDAFVDCLKEVDAEKLALYHTGALTPKLYHNPATLGPCIEKVADEDAFMTEHPLDLLSRGQIASKVPWMVGANSNEGLLIVGKYLQTVDLDGTFLLKDDTVWEEYLPHLLFYNPELSPDAAKKIREYFFRNETFDLEDDDTIKALGTVITEKMFYQPLETSSKLQSSVSPVYVFLYSYESFSSLFHYIRWASPFSILNAEVLLFFKSVYALIHLYILGTPKPSYGTAHGDEALLMYDVPINPKIVTDIFDLEMSQALVKTVVDFAHVGKPVKFKNLPWPAVKPNEPLKVMNIHAGDPEVLIDPFSRRLQFWKDLNLPRV